MHHLKIPLMEGSGKASNSEMRYSFDTPNNAALQSEEPVSKQWRWLTRYEGFIYSLWVCTQSQYYAHMTKQSIEQIYIIVTFIFYKGI